MAMWKNDNLLLREGKEDVKKVSYKGLFQYRDNARGGYREDHQKKVYLTDKHIGKYALVNLTTNVVYQYNKSYNALAKELKDYQAGGFWYNSLIKKIDEVKENGTQMYNPHYLLRLDREADFMLEGDGAELVEITE